MLRGKGEAKLDRLLSLRGLIFRGHLAQAASLAAQLAQEAESPRERAEILLEQARISALCGDWQEAMDVSSDALALPSVAPVSLLTLSQIRALALFELGEMMSAMEDLDRVDALAAEFPNCPSAFYASVLRARIVSRDQGQVRGEQLLSALWKSLDSGADDAIDRAHALIRADIDIQRVSGIPSPEVLISSYLIAETTGEKLYSALGALECAYSGHPSLERHFAPVVRTTSREYERVRRLVEEVEGRAPRESVSASSIRNAMTRMRATGEPGSLECALGSLQEITHIALLPQKMVFSLEPTAPRLQSVENLPQLLATLNSLSAGATPVPALFQALWKHVRYTPRLHASLVSSLLHRMKRRTGIRARVVQNQVRLQGTLVVTTAHSSALRPVPEC